MLPENRDRLKKEIAQFHTIMFKMLDLAQSIDHARSNCYAAEKSKINSVNRGPIEFPDGTSFSFISSHYKNQMAVCLVKVVNGSGIH